MNVNYTRKINIYSYERTITLCLEIISGLPYSLCSTPIWATELCFTFSSS